MAGTEANSWLRGGSGLPRGTAGKWQCGEEGNQIQSSRVWAQIGLSTMAQAEPGDPWTLLSEPGPLPQGTTSDRRCYS